MADVQNTKPKTMDINDLVRELSKNSTSSGTPTPVVPTPNTPQVLRPSFPSTPPTQKLFVPVSPSPSPSPSPFPVKPPLPKPEMPRPQFNVPPPPFSQPSQPKPAPTTPSTTPSPTAPGVKEYQSSIRTMNEDISKLKQGQKPMGVDVPRKVEQVAPVVPPSIPPKPSIPSQQFKVPSVNLGEAQKTGPLAPSKDFSRPMTPPSMPTKPKIEPKSQIYIPEGGSRDGNRNMLFLGIGAVALVAGFSYWFFVLRSPAPEVVIESPTPTPTPTPTATPLQDLKSIFSGVTELEPAATISGGEFRSVNYLFNIQGVKDKFLEILDVAGVAYPTQLEEVLGSDGAVFFYGQKELFDENGQIDTSSQVESRVVLIGELSDSMLAAQLVTDWENTMADDFKLFITTDKSVGYKGLEVKTFLDNLYRGVSIRYKNFPYADKSIDYTVVVASNGKSYLVITDSREAMYATINKLGGF